MRLAKRPFYDLVQMMDQVLGAPSAVSAESVEALYVDVKENDDGYVVKADVPGVKKEDLKIDFDKGTLSITAENAKEERSESEKMLKWERMWERRSRTLLLPDGIDEAGIVAESKDGVLTITLPKKTAVSTNVKIEVK